MDKQFLISIIEKYHLNGIHEKVKWTVKDKKIQIPFTSATMDLCGMVEAPNFDLDDCVLGIYDTNKLLKLIGITDQFLILNTDKHKLNIADNEYNLVYNLADLRMIPIETMVLDETQIDFTNSFDITDELIERYIRAKKALGTDEIKINAGYNEQQDPCIYFTLGGKTSHDDMASFSVPALKIDSLSPQFTYNANYLLEIFSENKETTSTGWFDENGILKLEFIDKDNIKSLYYLPPKE